MGAVAVLTQLDISIMNLSLNAKRKTAPPSKRKRLAVRNVQFTFFPKATYDPRSIQTKLNCLALIIKVLKLIPDGNNTVGQAIK